MKTLRSIVALLCTTLSLSAYAKDDITILYLNDFHGQVAAQGPMAGASKISTLLKSYQQKYPHSILVLGGDNYQGTAISNISHGQVDNDIFNYWGVKYSAVGNHDFDYGQGWFESWSKSANFKFLAANIKYKNSESTLAYTQPYGEIKLSNGYKVAFIGLATLETPETTATKNIQGLSFTNPVTSANHWTQYLNSPANTFGKPNVVILLTHIPSAQESNNRIDYDKNKMLGHSEINALTAQVSGISAVLSAHSHLKVVGSLNKVVVLQAMSQGKALGILHIDCHSQKDRCLVTPEEIELATVSKELNNDPNVDKIITKYTLQNQAVLNQIITIADQDLTNSPEDGGIYNIKLTYTIADTMRNITHNEIGLQNTFGIRRSLNKGPISYSQIYETMPFDNSITTLKLNGTCLKGLIEHSLPKNKVQLGVFAGIAIKLNKDASIQQIMVNGRALNPKRKYSLTTIDFLVNGGDGFNFSCVTNIHNTNQPIRDLVMRAWQKQGIIKVPHNWQSIYF